MRSFTKKLRRGAFRVTGASPFFYPEGRTYSPPRRRKVRLPPFPPLAKTADASLLLLSPQSRLCGAPFRRWYCLRQPCALRGGCGSCGSLMDNATSLRSCCHCPRSYRKHTRFYVCEVGYILYPTLRQLPVKNINLMFFTAMGIASSATPIFFLRKRNKNKNERTVRTNGNLSSGSKSGQQRNRAFCRGSFRLSELHQHPQ